MKINLGLVCFPCICSSPLPVVGLAAIIQLMVRGGAHVVRISFAQICAANRLTESGHTFLQLRSDISTAKISCPCGLLRSAASAA